MLKLDPHCALGHGAWMQFFKSRLHLFMTLTALCGLYALPSFGSQALDSFQYLDNRTARTIWVAKDHSPFPNRMPDGLRLDLPFKKGSRDRVYWQRDVGLNLSNATSFQLDLTCEAPDAMRSLAVYFKSGAGWYIWNRPLTQTGRQSIHMPKTAFSVEGSPRGWQHIEAIRISPWKGKSINTHLIMHGLASQRDSVLLVQGTRSIQGDSEKRAAEVVARRVGGWLSSAGISHNILTDEELFFANLNGVSTIILSYHHVLPDDLRKMLEAYMKRGGQLIVFFCKDEKLAKAMGFRLGEYSRSDIPGRWASMEFPRAKTLHLPEKVIQESWNVRPAYPDRSDAKVIGHWVNSMGKRQPEPAWVQSKQGAWMSHILLGGDQESKQQLLLGLIGRNDLAVWQSAAASLLARAPSLAGESDFISTRDAIHGLRKNADNPKQVDSLLENARKTYNRAIKYYDSGKYQKSAEACYQMKHLLVKSYALVQKGRKGEQRGVWDHHGIGWYPGDWERTCRELKTAGIGQVYANLQWGGLAHYPSHILPHSSTARILGDQAMAFRKAALKEGIKAHSWIVLWKLQNAPESFVQRMKKEDRLQVDGNGNIMPWLNPAHPANQEMMLKALEEMVVGYQMDGIHLDYVRYPNDDCSFDHYSRRAFEAELKRPVPSWPDDARKGGILASTYRKFRYKQITSFVKSVRDMINRVRPETTLSAAVFGKYPECRDNVGQDWKTWIDQGLVDYVTPMNYTPYTSRFHEWVREQTREHAKATYIHPGIGVTAAESDLSPAQVIEQIQSARELGAPGFLLFDLDLSLREDILPYLTPGILRE